MDYKKSKAPLSTVPRDLNELESFTGNIYESLMVLAKRANQINAELKEELNIKLQEFASFGDNLEEVFENREQIEISRYYEKMPKPTLIAYEEFNRLNYYFKYREFVDQYGELFETYTTYKRHIISIQPTRNCSIIIFVYINTKNYIIFTNCCVSYFISTIRRKSERYGELI